RTGRRLAAGELPQRFVHQFFIPVPGTDNEIAFLEFWSSTFEAEGYFRPHFEGLASSFEFTYADSEIVLGDDSAFGSDVVPEPAAAGTWLADQSLRDHQATVPQFRLGPLIRSAFAGWPRRFTALAHLAVTSWMAAAIVIASRVFADARRGPGAVFDDISGGAMIGFFGLFGYVFDQHRGRDVLLFWLAGGVFLLWIAITCPEGRLGFVC
ncbi:MAG: hypothetical protein M3357_12110, partial [Actinomycetota bacterium]|nr:hypothetical protein [Actinomycetota bacterium]